MADNIQTADSVMQQAQDDARKAQAQRAIALPTAQSMMGLPPIQAAAQAQTPSPSPTPNPPMPAIGTPQTTPSLPSVSPFMQKENQMVQSAQNRFTQEQNKVPVTTELWDKAKGIGGDHPGVLGWLERIPAMIGAGGLRAIETAGNVAAPGIMANVPGTNLNQAVRTHAAENALSAAEKNREAAAQSEQAQAGATKDIAAAQAAVTAMPKGTVQERTYNALLNTVNPKTGVAYTPTEAQEKVADVDESVKQTPEKQTFNYLLGQTNPKTQKPYTEQEAYGLIKTLDKTPANKIDVKLNEGIPYLVEGPDGAFAINDPNMPRAYRSVVDEATAAHGTHVGEENARQARTIGAETARQTRALDHQEKMSLANNVYKAYQPAMDSAERFSVMADAYPKVLKGDQQAGLNLLANHLGMTMGLQKGARLNQSVIDEAVRSRPWLAGVQAKVDKNGYLTGVTLTAEQARQMVDLGRSRYTEDVRKGDNEATYYSNQFGAAAPAPPAIKPSRATQAYYLNTAGGDHAKAEQLLQEEGWTVK